MGFRVKSHLSDGLGVLQPPPPHPPAQGTLPPVSVPRRALSISQTSRASFCRKTFLLVSLCLVYVPGVAIPCWSQPRVISQRGKFSVSSSSFTSLSVLTSVAVSFSLSAGCCPPPDGALTLLTVLRPGPWSLLSSGWHCWAGDCVHASPHVSRATTRGANADGKRGFHDENGQGDVQSVSTDRSVSSPYTPGRSLFPHPRQHSGCCVCVYLNHSFSNRWAVESHCGFNFGGLTRWACYVLVCYAHMFSEEMSVQVFCPFAIWIA